MLNKLTALFEAQNPDIKINRVTIPTDQKLVKVRQAVAAKTGPDVIMLYPGANAGEFKSGLAPLQKYITPNCGRRCRRSGTPNRRTATYLPCLTQATSTQCISTAGCSQRPA